jgi:hypothetical protein
MAISVSRGAFVVLISALAARAKLPEALLPDRMERSVDLERDPSVPE